MRIRYGIIVLTFVAPIAYAQFHDQGMTRPPVVRTDYAAKDAGTAADPLAIGNCLWGDCAPERTVFDKSNYWRQNWPCEGCAASALGVPHWTVVFNNEPRADPRNPGPPDISLPRARPAFGIMGFQTLLEPDGPAGEAIWRAHLVLDLVGHDNPVTGGIPFIGFGDFSNRATHGRPLARLRPAAATTPSVLSFGARLRDVIPPVPVPGGSQPAVLLAWLWVVAEWNDVPRAVFITLYHYNLQNSVPPNDPAVNRWNWPFRDSAFYPGADIVYIDAEDVDDYCGFSEPSLGHARDVDYRIDLTDLFSCVDDLGLFSDPMPDRTDIPVTQVLWATEATGLDGAIWIDVHDPKMLSARTVENPDSDAGPDPEPSVDGEGTGEIAARLAMACAARPGCRERHAIASRGEEAGLELPIAEQPSLPELLRALGR